ncbi:MAG TPA: hypothetical protein VGR26_04455 [Acidimicrobiales bacterium]|nr:hypothetical protein [Acidimicrobiales bacterium]
MSELFFAGVEDEERLSGDQRAFLDEARRMLEHTAETGRPALRTSARLEPSRGADQLLLELSKPGSELTIELSVGEGEIIIVMGEGEAWTDHWHFAPAGNDVYGHVADRGGHLWASTSLPSSFTARSVCVLPTVAIIF